MEQSTNTSKAITVSQALPSAWDQKKWDQIKKLFVPSGVSDADALIFLELSKVYDLNPFKKEIWCVPYKGKAQVFAGRDGYLAIAHRSGMFGGMETNFGYDSKGHLLWAESTVWNKSCEHPIKAKVFLKEYSTGMALWASKPHSMLQKVAESQALRRAFNINGLYAPEEFEPEVQNITPIEQTTQAKITHDQSAEVAPQQTQEGDPVAWQKALKYIETTNDITRLMAVRAKMEIKNFSKEEKNFLLDKIVDHLCSGIDNIAEQDFLVESQAQIKKYDWSEAHAEKIAKALAACESRILAEQF